MIKANESMYTRCPRAIQLESAYERYLVTLYYQCKEKNIFPFGGGPAEQPAVLMEAFDYIEEIISETRIRKRNANKQTPA